MRGFNSLRGGGESNLSFNILRWVNFEVLKMWVTTHLTPLLDVYVQMNILLIKIFKEYIIKFEKNIINLQTMHCKNQTLELSSGRSLIKELLTCNLKLILKS